MIKASRFFSMFEESCTGNSFLLDRQSISNFTWRFWGIERKFRRKQPEIFRLGDWFLHHDKSPAHTALASLDWTVVPNQPYSPDLVPCDLCLFPTIKKKKTLKGKRFATVEEMKTASEEALNNIKLHQFQRCFTQWEKRLDKCIASNGEYFEGD